MRSRVCPSCKGQFKFPSDETTEGLCPHCGAPVSRKLRGFAAIRARDPQRLAELTKAGGRASQASELSHKLTRRDARKGGKASSVAIEEDPLRARVFKLVDEITELRRKSSNANLPQSTRDRAFGAIKSRAQRLAKELL